MVNAPVVRPARQLVDKPRNNPSQISNVGRAGFQLGVETNIAAVEQAPEQLEKEIVGLITEHRAGAQNDMRGHMSLQQMLHRAEPGTRHTARLHAV